MAATIFFRKITMLLSMVLVVSLHGAAEPRFIENKGQVGDQFRRPRPDILYTAQTEKMTTHFKKDGYSFQLYKILEGKRENLSGRKVLHERCTGIGMEIYRLDISWINCNNSARILPASTLPGYDNFYSEVCPQGALEVKSYNGLTYEELYKGIDLKWYAKADQLKYDFVVKAGSDYRQIAWQLSGARKVTINSAGQLLIETPLGTLVEEAPLVIQGGKKLQASWKLKGQQISFAITGIDATKDLVIDPLVRLWGTYYGGSSRDAFCYSMVDRAGNVYLTAGTESNSSNIATIGSHQTTYGGAGTGVWLGDGLLVKMDGNGTRLWSTYYGGTGSEEFEGMDVDLAGNIFIGGVTTSTNSGVMATAGAHQTIPNIQTNSYEGDGFIARFTSAGARVWSTYYGDTEDDWVLGISLDPNNNLFVSGGTYGSANSGTVFATPGCHQPAHSTGTLNIDAHLSKFTNSGQRLWSTYYGGSSYDESFYCKADTLGNVYLPGQTMSTGANVIATAGAHQVLIGSTNNYRDGYLVKFNGSGTRLWGTYYGGLMNDYLHSCSVDRNNQLIAFGSSENSTGTTIATPGTHQSVHGGGNFDAFVVKFSPNGLRRWGSYYGGLSYEEIGVGTVAKNGDIVICGWTTVNSSTTIASCGAYQSTYGGGAHDNFLARLDSLGNRKWGTFFGGFGEEQRWCCVNTDASGNMFFGGSVNSLSAAGNIATSGAFQTSFAGGSSDLFLQKFDPCLVVPPAVSTNTAACFGQKAILTAANTCGLKYYSDPALTNLIYAGGSFTTAPLFRDTTFYVTDISCGATSSPAIIQFSNNASPTVAIVPAEYIVCQGASSTLFPSGATAYTWTGIPATNSVQITPTITTTYTLTGALVNGCKGTATLTIFVDLCNSLAELKEKENVLIFPNPSTEKIILKNIQNYRLTVYSSEGAIVYSANPDERETTMDVTSYAAGIYLFVFDQEGERKTIKVKKE